MKGACSDRCMCFYVVWAAASRRWFTSRPDGRKWNFTEATLEVLFRGRWERRPKRAGGFQADQMARWYCSLELCGVYITNRLTVQIGLAALICQIIRWKDYLPPKKNLLILFFSFSLCLRIETSPTSLEDRPITIEIFMFIFLIHISRFDFTKTWYLICYSRK